MTDSQLLAENNILKAKLSSAQRWMEREVRNQMTQIAKQKIQQQTWDDKNMFFENNIEEIISQKVVDFFGEVLLLNIPSSVIENIIAAEVNFYHMKKSPNADGLGVITSYHKSFDSLIESFITKGFRKFAMKKGQKFLRTNDLLEKSLHSIVTQWYIFSVWRLYHIIKLLYTGAELYDYGKCFKEYLDKYSYLKDALLDDTFYNNFRKLVESELVGKKRHVWKISYEETELARKLFIGDFENTDCILYQMIKTQEVL